MIDTRIDRELRQRIDPSATSATAIGNGRLPEPLSQHIGHPSVPDRFGGNLADRNASRSLILG